VGMVSIHDSTHRFLRLLLDTGIDGEDAHYLDIAKYLSETNRRTYRQGMTYDIANMTFHDSSGNETYIKVCTLPRTWACQAAWKRGFQEWMKQQRAAMDSLNITQAPTWHDFKIYMNADMVTDPDTNPSITDMEGNSFPEGDWDYSTFEIPQDGSTDPSEATIHMMGNNAGAYPSYTKVCLLKEFNKRINVPQEDPNIPAASDESVWSLLSADQPDVEVISEVVEGLETDNDFPPYHSSDIPGAGTSGAGKPSWPWVIREACIEGGGHHMAATGQFSAPCGLVCIETDHSEATGDNTVGLTIELVPGDYKGISARPMNGGGY